MIEPTQEQKLRELGLKFNKLFRHWREMGFFLLGFTIGGWVAIGIYKLYEAGLLK